MGSTLRLENGPITSLEGAFLVPSVSAIVVKKELKHSAISSLCDCVIFQQVILVFVLFTILDERCLKVFVTF